ncbi:MAG TPA: class I SAM-dependent methyltransferase [Gammaproteobacteria bacterium]|nr:class I SAM-dependent methyltransferase [Gammaproteobacteria bacterium]
MAKDDFIAFKEIQKQSWSLFAPLEVVTTMCAATLVNFSKLSHENVVLDVGCGTGVVAITAARLGAKISAMDLSPALIDHAKKNIAIAKVEVDLQEGDVENLPYPDASFDVVLSQFGHMFAPRPSIATHEMLRVLKPGGTIAFSTWPPDLFTGRLFSLVGKFLPLPEGVSPPPLWGDPHFVRAQLGTAVDDLTFDQGVMRFPAMSLGHYRQSVETTIGPVFKLVEESKKDSARLQAFRDALEELASQYFTDNHIHQHFLMSRARKK